MNSEGFPFTCGTRIWRLWALCELMQRFWAAGHWLLFICLLRNQWELKYELWSELVRACMEVTPLVLSVAAMWFWANHFPFLKYMVFNVHLKNYVFIISIFLPILCLHCLMGFSLVIPSRDSSAAVVPGRLVAEPLLLRSFPYWAWALGWAAFSSCLVRAP